MGLEVEQVGVEVAENRMLLLRLLAKGEALARS